MGRLGAKAARLDAIGSGRLHGPLRERIDGAARISERAVDFGRALHDEREIGTHLMRRLALAYTGDTENEQQIGFAAGVALKAQAHAGRCVLGFALAPRSAVRPIDLRVDGARDSSAQVAVAGG
jgi:hypothetical protein